jgi:hypothetical protein
MNPVTGTLVLVVTNEKLDWKRPTGIHAIDIVIRSDRFLDSRFVRSIFAVPKRDDDGKFS